MHIDTAALAKLLVECLARGARVDASRNSRFVKNPIDENRSNFALVPSVTDALIHDRAATDAAMQALPSVRDSSRGSWPRRWRASANSSTVTVATSRFIARKWNAPGWDSLPWGRIWNPLPQMVRDVMDARRGPELLVRRMLYPAVPAAYAEVMDALRGADAVVTHPITFASQIAAEKSRLPWVSTVTAPASFFSRYDPSVIAPAPFLARLRGLGPGVNGLILKMGRARTRTWMKPITEFRASLGMPPGQDPLFAGQHSPERVLAMFSRVLAEPQPDWPPQAEAIGFPFYDQAEHGQGLDPGERALYRY